MNGLQRFNLLGFILLLPLLLLLPGCEKEGGGGSWLAPPANVAAASGDSQITVSFDGVTSADRYNLYWSTEPGVGSQSGTLVENVPSPWLHSLLSNGTTYYYVVTSLNSGGESGVSNEVSAIPRPPVPSPPWSVTVTAGDTLVSLSWNEVSRVDKYNIYWSDVTGVTKATGNKVAGVGTPYAVTELTNGTPYYFVVTSDNLGGESEDSAEVSATPDVEAPDTPLGVSATPGDTEITISWDPSTAATSYNLYWAMEPGVTALTGTPAATVTSPHSHTGLTNGTAYYYVVTAVGAGGESAESREVGATPPMYVNPRPTLTSSIGDPSSRFGKTVAISGDFIAVGANLSNPSGISNAGSVDLFLRDAATGAWGWDTNLSASDRAVDDIFGNSVAIDGDQLVVGAAGADPGAVSNAGRVYFFSRDPSDGTWSQTSNLAASDGAASDSFGGAVAIDATSAIVGAPNADPGGQTDAGAAYLFDYSSATDSWSQAQKITGSGGSAGDKFGKNVAIFGDTAAVGSPSSDPGGTTDAGVVYIFGRDSGSGLWSESQALSASDGSNGDAFGSSVAMENEFLVIGAKFADVDPGGGLITDAGAVYLFSWDSNAGNWAEYQKLTAPDPGTNDNFGQSVSIQGITILIGAPGSSYGSIPGAGAAFLFEETGDPASWEYRFRLDSQNPNSNGNFGNSVSLGADSAVIGAHMEDPVMGGGTVNDGGAVYVFE